MILLLVAALGAAMPHLSMEENESTSQSSSSQTSSKSSETSEMERTESGSGSQDLQEEATTMPTTSEHKTNIIL